VATGLNLRDVLELSMDGLNQCALAHPQLVEQGQQVVFHGAGPLGDELEGLREPELKPLLTEIPRITGEWAP
jgi:hypothetical protein